MHAGQHVLLTEILIVVFFDLRRKSEVGIRIDYRGIRGSARGSVASTSRAMRTKSRQHSDRVRKDGGRLAPHAPGARLKDPGVVVDFGIDMAEPNHSEAAQQRWLQERIEGEAKTDSAGRRIRVGRNRRDFDATNVVVKGEMSDGEKIDRRAVRVCRVVGDLRIAEVRVVSVKRTKTEVP